MTIVIAYSIRDLAGTGIARSIVTHLDCKEGGYAGAPLGSLKEVFLCVDRTVYIMGFEKDVVELEELEELSRFAKYYVVVSRHYARAGKPSLTTHPTGNPWGRSDAGGRPWEMTPSNPVLMWLALNELRRYGTESGLNEYDVCYEVTHHGPTSISKPIAFIELGSSENEWRNTKAQNVVALSTIKAIEKAELGNVECVVTVGFGGSHYAPIFTARAFREGECYGHMIPNYVIKELSLDELKFVARRAIELTPGVQRVVIEKMRLEVRKVIEEVAQAKGLEMVRY